MTAVPPIIMQEDATLCIVFQPLKGNDGRAALFNRFNSIHMKVSFNPSKEMTAVPPRDAQQPSDGSLRFQPLKGNDGRAAQPRPLLKQPRPLVSTPQRK